MPRFVKTLFVAALLFAMLMPSAAFAAKSEKYALQHETVVKGDTLTIHGEIDGAESAEKGHWKLIPTGKGSGGKAGLPVKELKSEALAFTHQYSNLAPGEYCFNLKYEGKLDGSTATYPFLEKFCVTVTGDSSKEPSDSEQTENHPTAKKPPENTEETTTKQMKAGNGDPQQGGKMPKTATDQPLALLAGAVLLLTGVGLLFFKRHSAHNGN
ncbi:LPXTG cell wall anchor domain-containing protein [Salinithrix halophila]|uniref:LPXTG cell wall anchor domain-containing protein n=1 Tax=Salinithrix halophila TaxID=1485204 RepID=A0ABV8JJA1_9BACL